jgi:hypothetical protein
MKVLLRTRCGCERVIEVQDISSYVYLPIFRDLPHKYMNTDMSEVVYDEPRSRIFRDTYARDQSTELRIYLEEDV